MGNGMLDRIEMAPPDPRDLALRRILADSRTTHQAILAAAYGGWPPKGLEVDPSRIPTTPLSVLNDAKTFGGKDNTLGFVLSAAPGTVHINPGHEHWPTAFSTLVHESTHTMQLRDDPFRETFGPSRAAALAPKWRAESNEYLLDDQEIQARISQIVAEGYVGQDGNGWGRMPTSRLELQAGLQAFGVLLHPAAQQALSETPEGQAAVAAFGTAPPGGGKASTAVTQMQNVAEALSDTGALVHLHEEVLPHLYGHLLEGYGDRLGRERMGLPSMEPARAAVAQVKTDGPRAAVESWMALPDEQRRLAHGALMSSITDLASRDTKDPAVVAQRVTGIMQHVADRVGEQFGPDEYKSLRQTVDLLQPWGGTILQKAVDLGADPLSNGMRDIIADQGLYLRKRAKNPDLSEPQRDQAQRTLDTLSGNVRTVFEGSPITETPYTITADNGAKIRAPALVDLRLAAPGLRGTPTAEAAAELVTVMKFALSDDPSKAMPPHPPSVVAAMRTLAADEAGRRWLDSAVDAIRCTPPTTKDGREAAGAVLAGAVAAGRMDPRGLGGGYAAQRALEAVGPEGRAVTSLMLGHLSGGPDDNVTRTASRMQGQIAAMIADGPKPGIPAPGPARIDLGGGRDVLLERAMIPTPAVPATAAAPSIGRYMPSLDGLYRGVRSGAAEALAAVERRAAAGPREPAFGTISPEPARPR